jgi:hypothetical protein
MPLNYQLKNTGKADDKVYKNIWKAYIKLYLADWKDFVRYFTLHILPSDITIPHGQVGWNSITVYMWDSSGIMARQVNCMTLSHELVHAIAHWLYRIKTNNSYEGQLKARAVDQTLHYYHGYDRQGEREEGVQTVKVRPLSIFNPEAYIYKLGSYEMIDYAWIEGKALSMSVT